MQLVFQQEIGAMTMFSDVSLLNKKQQIYLKLLEILNFNMQGYHIFIKNISDYIPKDSEIFKMLEQSHFLYLKDNYAITDTKEELLVKLSKKYNLNIDKKQCVMNCMA